MRSKNILSLIALIILQGLSLVHVNASAAPAPQDPIPFGIAATPPLSGNLYESITLSSSITNVVAIPTLWYNIFSGETHTCQDIAPLILYTQSIGSQVVVRFEAVVLGDPAVPPELGESSFGNQAVIDAYLEQIACFAGLNVDYLVLGPEINFAYRLNRAEFDYYATLYQQAYDLVKQMSPETKVGVSYQYLSMLYFDEWASIDLIGPQDYIGFTKYFAITIDRFINYPGPSSVPDNFFSPIRTRYPDTPIVFTEYAWSSFYSPVGEDLQAQLIINTPRLMAAVQPEMVVWASLFDLQEFGQVLEATDFVGLWSKEGASQPKPAWFYLKNMFNNGFFATSVPLATQP